MNQPFQNAALDSRGTSRTPGSPAKKIIEDEKNFLRQIHEYLRRRFWDFYRNRNSQKRVCAWEAKAPSRTLFFKRFFFRWKWAEFSASVGDDRFLIGNEPKSVGWFLTRIFLNGATWVFPESASKTSLTFPLLSASLCFLRNAASFDDWNISVPFSSFVRKPKANLKLNDRLLYRTDV